MTTSTHIIKRNGYYYFRVRIPQDLQPIFNRAEIKKSLKTDRFRIAKQRASLLSFYKEHVFEEIRTMKDYSKEEAIKVAKLFMEYCAEGGFSIFKQCRKEVDTDYAIKQLKENQIEYALANQKGDTDYIGHDICINNASIGT